MKKYIGIIGVSYDSRKILYVEQSGKYGFPTTEITGDSIEECVKKFWTDMFVQSYNFNMNFEKCFYLENHSDYSIRYVWVFTCLEDFDESSVQYQWNQLENLKVAPDLKLYIGENIYREIRIRCENHTRATFATLNENNYIQGSKQAFSRVLPLKILHPEIVFENIPNILDAFYLLEAVKKSGQSEGTFVIDDSLCNSWAVTNLLPMLLYRHKQVILKSTPNGCQIGQRPLDIYLYIIKRFDVEINFYDDMIVMEHYGINRDREVSIPVYASFTATSMAIYFALQMNSVTVIKNASLEPEILFLTQVAEKLGYYVKWEDRSVTINGNRNVDCSLNQVITIPADRNVLVTRMVDSIYEGNAFHYQAKTDLCMDIFIDAIREMGIEVIYDNKIIDLMASSKVNNFKKHMVFGHYPELCSDWQPFFMILNIFSEDEVIIFDILFNDRYRYLSQLKKIYPGLQIEVSESFAVIKNSSTSINVKLKGVDFVLPDIRGSAAIIIALSRCSDFSLSNVTQMLRGYENLYQISDHMGKVGEYEFY